MVNQQRYCAAANCDNAAEHLFKWPEHKIPPTYSVRPGRSSFVTKSKTSA